MKKIISTRKFEQEVHPEDFINEITKALDEFVKDEWRGVMDSVGFCTYMMFRRHDGAAIRFPGATRGSVNFNKDHIITEVLLHTDIDSIYKEGALDVLKTYIGCELVIPEGVINREKDDRQNNCIV